MNFFKSYYRSRYSNCNYATKPAIVEAAIKYLEYIEMQESPSEKRTSYWISVPRNQLSMPEKSTKKAALMMLNAWLLGDLKITVENREQIPPTVSVALNFLDHCLHGSDGTVSTGCCSTGLQGKCELDDEEQVLKSTSLELLRNWFNGELEIKAVVPQKRVFIKQGKATIRVPQVKQKGKQQEQ